MHILRQPTRTNLKFKKMKTINRIKQAFITLALIVLSFISGASIAAAVNILIKTLMYDTGR